MVVVVPPMMFVGGNGIGGGIVGGIGGGLGGGGIVVSVSSASTDGSLHLELVSLKKKLTQTFTALILGCV